jgi:hypothetical protein
MAQDIKAMKDKEWRVFIPPIHHTTRKTAGKKN